jgi:hypothetical protein
MNKNNDIKHNHRFLDESGDTTFYGKGRKNILGTIGVSNCFIIGMLKIKQPLHELRKAVNELQPLFEKRKLLMATTFMLKMICPK